MLANIATIILTYNEADNIEHALRSVCGWAGQVFVVDSNSDDATVTLARKFECQVVQHSFEDYGKQRNWALQNLPITADWILFLDADERATPELCDEISRRIAQPSDVNGYYLRRRFFFLGRWIRRGYYSTWILRLFRRGKGACEERSVNEHIVVDGPTARLDHDLIHEDRKPIGRWIQRHDDFALREARELLRQDRGGEIGATLVGSQVQRKRWIRRHVWNRLPPLIRPPIYFGYRYFLRGGVLDGKEALIYHFLQALWFPLLIDVKYLEMRRSAGRR
jgi:glycosyltransferase involved in cell wall biosynthesis